MTDIVDRLLRPKPWASEALIAEDAAEEIKMLRKVKVAAENLVSVKGRFHTEKAFKELKSVLDEAKASLYY